MKRFAQFAGLTIGWLGFTGMVSAQAPSLPGSPGGSGPVHSLPSAPAPQPDAPRLPINLPTALQLAQVQPIDVALASQRLEAALAQQDKAQALWLPTIYSGVDYARHDGQIQDIAGRVFSVSKQSLLIGYGPTAVFAVSDAIHAPLAARQIVRAREADVQTTLNDTFVSVAETYFAVQQARGEVAGALTALAKTEELVRRTDKLAATVAPPSEANRARTELARRKQALIAAQERWRVSSAELTRWLRLQADAVVEPMEPPQLEITLVDLKTSVDELIPIALTNRPELAARQAVVQATLQRLKQERQRPLVPSVLLRGNATNPGGTLAGGSFGGGVNGAMDNFGSRFSVDAQLLWELQNLGLGNRASVRERRAENQQAILELFRTQDRIAAEVVQAHVQAKAAVERLSDAREALKYAHETTEQSLDGMQLRRVGEVNVLYVRPAEVVAAVQVLAQAYADFYAAVTEHNRAQCRLYRALGHPAQCVNLVPTSVDDAKKK